MVDNKSFIKILYHFSSFLLFIHNHDFRVRCRILILIKLTIIPINSVFNRSSDCFHGSCLSRPMEFLSS